MTARRTSVSRRAAAPLALMAGMATIVAQAPPSGPAGAFTKDEMRRILALSPLPPPPPDPTNAVADDPAAAHLGRFLFFEERFSANGEVSCATCHDPEQAFTDGRRTAQAIGALDRHTPSLWNVAYNRWFFWDGRADTLWAQAVVPIETPTEHGTSRLKCVHVVHEDPGLRAAYEAIFGPMPDLADAARFPPDGRPVSDEPEHPHHGAWISMTAEDRETVNGIYANLAKAIAAYERRLIRRRAPFDVFVEGLRSGDAASLAALTPAAQRGLQLFVGRADCLRCHFGPHFSDGEFHSTGVPPLGGGPLHDAGRYEGIESLRDSAFSAAGPYADAAGGAAAAAEAAEKVHSLLRSPETWGQFKTPSLRNVALTAPYMHQGQLAALGDVLRHYSTLEDAVLPSHHQEQLLVPLELAPAEMAALEAFLVSLTGEEFEDALLTPPLSPRWPDEEENGVEGGG